MNDLSAVEAIFFAALDKGSPEECAAYLDQACGTDPELRRHVERLLNAQPMHDFPARVIQHETDHLDGVLFFDRMTSLASMTFLEEYSRYWRKTED